MPRLLYRAIGPLVGAETYFGASEGYSFMFMLIVAPGEIRVRPYWVYMDVVNFTEFSASVAQSVEQPL